MADYLLFNDLTGHLLLETGGSPNNFLLETSGVDSLDSERPGNDVLRGFFDGPWPIGKIDLAKLKRLLKKRRKAKPVFEEMERVYKRENAKLVFEELQAVYRQLPTYRGVERPMARLDFARMKRIYAEG